jgi:hypothetical protein
MLSWRRAKADLACVLEYEENLAELWRLEDAACEQALRGYYGPLFPSERQAAIQHDASRDPQYQVVRDRVARATNRIQRIARENRIATNLGSLPPPAVGGAIIPVNLFSAVLHDNSHGGIDRQRIVDALNQTRGAAAERIGTEFWRMLNPLHWVKEALVFVLRIPFMLIEATGFDMGKVEDHVLSKIFKFLELGLLLWIAIRLGLGKQELYSLFEKLLAK